MLAGGLRWLSGQCEAYRITVCTLLVPAPPALGAGALGIGRDCAVLNEKTFGDRIDRIQQVLREPRCLLVPDPHLTPFQRI